MAPSSSDLRTAWAAMMSPTEEPSSEGSRPNWYDHSAGPKRKPWYAAVARPSSSIRQRLAALPRQAGEEDKARLSRTLTALDEEIRSLSANLHNPSFLDRAPAAVVDKTRRRLLELEERRSALSTGGP